MRPPPDPGNNDRPGPPGPPPPDAFAGPPLPSWRSSCPAYHPRRTSSGDGHHHLHAALPPLNLTRLGSSGGMSGGGGGFPRASTPGGGGGGGGSGAAAAAGPPSPPPVAAADPATEAAVWAALACAASAGCPDPALAALADAADGASGLRVAPAVPFTAGASGRVACAPPALPHLAHPDSAEAPAWLERLVAVGASDSAPPTSTTSLPTPAVVVGCRGAWLALPPPALAHWDRGGPFTPAGGPAAVSYVALVPAGMEAAAAALLASTSRAWASAGLGTHAPAGSVPGADARGLIAYDAAGGVAALARAYAALHLALARARPPMRWPGVVAAGDGALLGGASPGGSLVVYVLPPGGSEGDAASAAAALQALVACARAPTAPPPPAGPPLSRLARSSDGGGGSTAALHRLFSDAGTPGATTTFTRAATPDWHRTAAARELYRRESGGHASSRPGSPAPGRSGSGDLAADGAVAVPCVLQALPGTGEEDLTGRRARTLALCVFNKVAAAGGGGGGVRHQPLAAMLLPAGPTPALHCAFAVVPPGRGDSGSGGDATTTTLVALAFGDGTGELAPSARVVRVAGGAAALPAAVLAACRHVFARAAACASREDTRPVRTVITRLGAPPPGEAAAWEAAGLGQGGARPPTCVLALSADPPYRLAGLGPVRAAPFVAVNTDDLPPRACIVWASEHAEMVRAGVVVPVAGEGVGLAAAASELHALGALAGGVETAVAGGGWASVCSHLPGHCATALRLARLVAAAGRGGGSV